MKCLIIICLLSLTSLTECEDNVAMESQVNYHRTKYHKPDYYREIEEESESMVENHYNNPSPKSHGKIPKKYSKGREQKEDVYLNKNNYATRAREPRDEVPWQPITHISETTVKETTRNHFHDVNLKKPETHGFKDGDALRNNKRPQVPQNFDQRFKPHYLTQIEGDSGSPPIFFQGRPEPAKESQPNEHQSLDGTTFFRPIEENMNNGKLLGFSSFVEHFSENDDAEEMKTALREGSLDDIKKLVPKSGVTFQMYHGDETNITQRPRAPSPHKYEQSGFKASASSWNQEKQLKFNKYNNEFEDQYDKALQNRIPLYIEKKNPVKLYPENKPTESFSFQSFNDKPTRISFRNEEIRATAKPTEKYNFPSHNEKHTRINFRNEQNKPVKPKPRRLPQTNNKFHMNDYFNIPDMIPVVEETRIYPQIAAASKQTYRPIQMEYLVDPRNESESKPTPQPEQNVDAMPNDTQEETKKPGSFMQAIIVHPSPVKPTETESVNYHPEPSVAPASANYYPEPSAKPAESSYYPEPTSRPVENSKFYPEPSARPIESANYHPEPSRPDHTKYFPEPSQSPPESKPYYDRLRSNPNVNIQPIDNTNHGKPNQGNSGLAFSHPSHTLGQINVEVKKETPESSRSPVQFTNNESANNQLKFKKLPEEGPKHIKKYVQKYTDSLFKNMKFKENDQFPRGTEIKHNRYYKPVELIPKPAALVNPRSPKFDMETPMMTEEEFKVKFGHLPIVTTPKVPNYALKSPKPQDHQAQGLTLTQYWTMPEHKLNGGNNHEYQKLRNVVGKLNDILNHSEKTNNPEKLSELLAEASSLEQMTASLERPSPNFKDGRIFLTKPFEGGLSDVFIKNSDVEQLKNFRYDLNHNLKRKPIIVGPTLIPSVNMYDMPTNIKTPKYELNFSNGFVLQKRGDGQYHDNKNVTLVSEKENKDTLINPTFETGFKPMINHVNHDTSSQNVHLGGNTKSSNEHDHFSVSASYQINRKEDVKLR